MPLRYRPCFSSRITSAFWYGGACWLLLPVALLVGCSEQQELAPVTGIVTVDGEPVANAQVLFMSSQHRPAAGETDANGRYVLSTYKNGDGAAIGSHNVTVTARPTIRVSPAGGSEPPGSTRPMPQRQGDIAPVPEKYSNAAQPLISVEVKPGENDIPLKLTRD